MPQRHWKQKFQIKQSHNCCSYVGTPCNLNPIIKIAEKNKIKIIEDTAWGCGGKLNGKYLGTIGDAGTYSFDFAKTITTGEGGMTVFKNKSYLDKAKAYHDADMKIIHYYQGGKILDHPQVLIIECPTSRCYWDCSTKET